MVGRESCLPMPKAIAKEAILWAADQIDRGITHEFGAATWYAVVINENAYPPKFGCDPESTG